MVSTVRWREMRTMLAISTEDDIIIDRESVCRYIGYGADYQPPARVSSLIDEYVENAHHLIEPSYSYIIRDIDHVQDSLVFIGGSIVLESDIIARLLERCQKVALLVVTIGDHLEDMAGWLAKQGNIVQAAVLEATGSDAVEKVADFVQCRVEEIAQRYGMIVSRRFSPGYCDWDIKQQKMIFRAVDGNLAGVHLTNSCLMVPRKSISGIMGIGAASEGVGTYNPCMVCDRENCCGRR